MTLAFLTRTRVLHITMAFGRFRRLSLRDVGQEWGEGEWTDRDLWR